MGYITVKRYQYDRYGTYVGTASRRAGWFWTCRICGRVARYTNTPFAIRPGLWQKCMEGAQRHVEKNHLSPHVQLLVVLLRS